MNREADTMDMHISKAELGRGDYLAYSELLKQNFLAICLLLENINSRQRVRVEANVLSVPQFMPWILHCALKSCLKHFQRYVFFIHKLSLQPAADAYESVWASRRKLAANEFCRHSLRARLCLQTDDSMEYRRNVLSSEIYRMSKFYGVGCREPLEDASRTIYLACGSRSSGCCCKLIVKIVSSLSSSGRRLQDFKNRLRLCLL